MRSGNPWRGGRCRGNRLAAGQPEQNRQPGISRHSPYHTYRPDAAHWALVSTLPASQISPHRALRVDLAGRWGPVAALRAAAGGNGPDLGVTALLVPGYTGSKEDFAPLIDPIADAGFDVVAIDLPGQYESPGPDREADYRAAPLG